MQLVRRSPYGERGLKFPAPPSVPQGRSRSPYGERGLKYPLHTSTVLDDGSLSLRRAWIEIPGAGRCRPGMDVALLTESVD